MESGRPVHSVLRSPIWNTGFLPRRYILGEPWQTRAAQRGRLDMCPERRSQEQPVFTRLRGRQENVQGVCQQRTATDKQRKSQGDRLGFNFWQIFLTTSAT